MYYVKQLSAEVWEVLFTGIRQALFIGDNAELYANEHRDKLNNSASGKETR
jgi:hypothetical protein